MKNKIKILLINPEDIEKYQRYSEMNPYVGLAYIATFVEKMFGDNVSVEIVEMLPSRIKKKDVLSKIRDNRYDICGFTSKTYNFPFAQSMAASIKELAPETLIIFGGAHATALPEDTVQRHSIDAVVLREGEIVFKNIVQNILGDRHPFEDVKGVVYKSDGEVINNGFANLIDNLDEIPIPNWDKYYDLNIYDRCYDKRTGKLLMLIPIFASRGCPYGCHFCQPLLTRAHRTRSITNVIDEIEYLADRYKIKRIYFEDSIFGLKKEWFLSFSQQYMDRGLHKTVKWGFETNVNCVDLERMELAKEAGCVYVYYGIESASDQVHQHVGKGVTKEKIYNAINVSKKAGIYEVAGSFIFGLPYETSETAKETLDFIKEAPLDNININLLDVYPGTELYTMVEKGIGGIRWIPEKKDKWDACGRTLVKTLVNDLDSVEKLEALHIKALQLREEKYKKNYYSYLKKIFVFTIYYTFHNHHKLIRLFKRTLTTYFPRVFKLN